MNVKESIFSTLNRIASTFYLAIPSDNDETPVVRYYFTTQQPAQIGDDKELERRYFLTVDLFDSLPASEKADEIERAILSQLGEFSPTFTNRNELKENSVFHYVLEFTLLETR